MQWVQDPSRSNVANLSNVRPDISRHCRNKKKEYLKSKMEEHETNSKIINSRNLYGGISDCKKGYHPRTNIVNEGRGDLFTGSHSMLSRWRNHFSQLFNIH